jgi:hypothetical protein
MNVIITAQVLVSVWMLNLSEKLRYDFCIYQQLIPQGESVLSDCMRLCIRRILLQLQMNLQI